jgi:hypothetical protein
MMGGGGANEKEAGSQMTSIMILHCYSNISLEKGREVRLFYLTK